MCAWSTEQVRFLAGVSHIHVHHRCSESSKCSLSFMKRTRSFTFFSILFLANVSERTFFILSYTIWMKIYENIQHSMDIYDEIFIIWHLIFLNLSIHWHLEFRYSIEYIVLNCVTIILHVLFHVLLRSLLFLKRTRSLTFFIPISPVRYIYDVHLWLIDYSSSFGVLMVYICQETKVFSKN